MAFENPLNVSDVGHFLAAEDLSALQYTMVELNSAFGVIKPTGQGTRCFGVLQNAPAIGEAAAIRVFGISKVVSDEVMAGAAGGTRVTTAGTNGRAEPAASGDFVLGHLLEAGGAAATLTTMFVNPSQVPLA